MAEFFKTLLRTILWKITEAFEFLHYDCEDYTLWEKIKAIVLIMFLCFICCIEDVNF